MNPFDTLPAPADVLEPIVAATFLRPRPNPVDVEADAQPVADAVVRTLTTGTPTLALMRLGTELICARKLGHKFYAGPVMVTPGASTGDTAAVSEAVLSRHLRGDWGDVGSEDRKANDDALRTGERILSVYNDVGVGDTFFATLWVITERSVVATEEDPALNRLRYSTTILLPSEY